MSTRATDRERKLLMRGREMIEVAGVIVTETDAAILFHDGGAKNMWLPKSKIEIQYGKDDTAEVMVPEWLTKCSQCTHWNDGYGKDDICGCLGCPQNCDNYTMTD